MDEQGMGIVAILIGGFFGVIALIIIAPIINKFALWWWSKWD